MQPYTLQSETAYIMFYQRREPGSVFAQPTIRVKPASSLPKTKQKAAGKNSKERKQDSDSESDEDYGPSTKPADIHGAFV